LIPETILTIGIPTHNRADTLPCLLEGIFAQLAGDRRDRVEVLISDNASTDSTPSCVEGFAKRFPGCVSYYRNEENIGFSRNVDQAVRRSRGTFVLLMSDDDGLEPGAIAALLKVLDEHRDLSIVFLDSRHYDPGLRDVVPGVDPAPPASDRMYGRGLDYMREKRSFPPSLVSGNVVRKAAWLAAGPECFQDTICIHLLCILHILASGAAYRFARPYVKYRTEAKSGDWSRDPLYPFRFFLGWLLGCRSVRGVYPRGLCRRLYHVSLRSVIFNTVRQKILRGQFNKPLLKAELRGLLDWRDPMTWLAYMMLDVPRWMVAVPFRHFAEKV
jgi:glycosyltransferase involved in cell wall biosynthesis